MGGQPLFPCGRVSRRGFLHQAGGGFLGVAMGALWAEAGEIKDALHGPHFPPRAKSVIFLFMCGGVSHIDTFDPKDNKWAGKLIDAVGFGDNNAEMRRPVIPCQRTFTRHGQSGIPVSDWFPHVGGVIDEIAVVRSMWCHEGNHFPAVIETCTGHRGRAVRPPDLRELGLLRARDGQQEPADVREPRPGVLARAVDRRLPRRGRGRHAVPAGRDADPEPEAAQGRDRRRARPADAGAPGAEPRVPRAPRHRVRHRGPGRGLRAGRPDAARRAGGRRPLRASPSTSGTSTGSARPRPTTSAGSSCWPAGSRSRASGSSRSATPGAATAAGTPTATSRPTARSAGPPTSRSPG